MKFRDFSEKFEEVMKKMATFEGKKRKNLDFLIFLAKKFGKVSSRFWKSFDFHEKYLPLPKIEQKLMEN